MKKRILVTIMAMTMVAGTLAGCGSSAKTEPVAEPAVEETAEATEEVVEEPTEAPTEEPTEAAEEPVEEEVVEEPAREVKMYTYDDGTYGPYEIPSYDEDNEYVKKLRDQYDSDVYPGVYIAKEDKGWIWYFEPETEGDYRYVGGVEDPDYLQGEELDSFMNEIETNLNTFIKKCEDGELKPVDLDDDGKISYAEAYIQSFYIMTTDQEKPYSGLITFFDYDDILW